MHVQEGDDRAMGQNVRWLGLLVVLSTGVALAEPPDVPDPSMIPDASVGYGGAQQGSEESDSSSNCLGDNDCDRGLRCVQRRCTWQQYRHATFIGCGGGGGTAVALCALGALRVRRRGRRL